MSHYAESCRAARARSRLQYARSGRIAPDIAGPLGELSGFPLIPCPECSLTRVVEGRTKKVRTMVACSSSAQEWGKFLGSVHVLHLESTVRVLRLV